MKKECFLALSHLSLGFTFFSHHLRKKILNRFCLGNDDKCLKWCLYFMNSRLETILFSGLMIINGLGPNQGYLVSFSIKSGWLDFPRRELNQKRVIRWLRLILICWKCLKNGLKLVRKMTKRRAKTGLNFKKSENRSNMDKKGIKMHQTWIKNGSKCIKYGSKCIKYGAKWD